jgi:hypothetical protein
VCAAFAENVSAVLMRARTAPRREFPPIDRIDDYNVRVLSFHPTAVTNPSHIVTCKFFVIFWWSLSIVKTCFPFSICDRRARPHAKISIVAGCR